MNGQVSASLLATGGACARHERAGERELVGDGWCLPPCPSMGFTWLGDALCVVAVPRALSGRNLFITTTFELLNIFHLISHDLIAKRKKMSLD
jgi:hypothetical protein